MDLIRFDRCVLSVSQTEIIFEKSLLLTILEDFKLFNFSHVII